MKRMNNKGFTLVELIAVIVLLVLVMGIGAVSVTKIMKDAKDRDYNLLKKNINSAVESYYQECKFVNKTCTDTGTVTLGYLVDNGFLKGNATITSGTNKDKMTLVNPRDNINITTCSVKYTVTSGKISVQAVSPSGSCPTSY